MRYLIIYSTTSGNTELALEYITRVFGDNGWIGESHRAEQTQGINSDQYDLIIFACGTYGHGLLQERMHVWIEKYGPQVDLLGKPCAVIGLGDTKYETEYLCESAAILAEFVKTHNGRMITEPLRIVKSPLKHEEKIQNWSTELIRECKNMDL